MQGGVETIQLYMDEFIAYAKEHPDLANVNWREHAFFTANIQFRPQCGRKGLPQPGPPLRM